MIITKSEAQYNLIDWWKKVVKDNYANFEGRARRAEYWNFILANVILSIAMYLIMIVFVFSIFLAFLAIAIYLLLLFYNLAILIPNLAVAVRRLHDTNKSGWLILLGLVPILGQILLIIFLATEGDRGTNQYGLDPKIDSNFINEIGVREY